MSKKLTTEDFIERSKLIHGDKYDLSKCFYKTMKDIVIIGCPIHGFFEQIAESHYIGRGCKKCGRIISGKKQVSTKNDFIKKSNIIHNGFYNYDKVIYMNNKTNIIITCSIHGDFLQKPSNHTSGKGCKKCALIKNKDSTRIYFNTDDFINKALEIHGDKYNYSESVFYGYDSGIKIKCRKHGEFEQKVRVHLSGGGCRKCGNIICASTKYNDVEYFINKAMYIHNDFYDYSKAIYAYAKSNLEIICPNHGSFFQSPNNHFAGKGCPRCSNGLSKNEDIIFKNLSQYIECEQSNRKILNGKEIDIYIPELKLGIEYHGLYWHSDKFRNKNYHLEKLELANSKGVQLIQIFEDEWINKKEIVESRLNNLINKSNKIYARKTRIQEVPTSEAMKFLEENHIQGKVGGKLKLGLYLEDQLVSLMTFGNLRKNLGQTSKEGSYELLRFCNKLNTTVIGGASKLFKYFIKTYSPEKVISYADRRWSEGKLYHNLGFDFVHNSKPNYFYVKNSTIEREARFKYRKDTLVSQGYDKNKTEREIMKELGYNRIYDCGAMKFEWKKEV